MEQFVEMREEIIDHSSVEARTRLARMVMQLFDHWQIPPKAQVAILGFSPASKASLNRFRIGKPLPNRSDVLDRAGNLLAIHKSLRILFPHDLEFVYSWVSAPNRAFNGMRPLDVMVKFRFGGLIKVRAYLEHARFR